MESDQSPPPLPNTSDNPATLFSFLAGRDVRCPSCNYNLRDLKSAACPECGTPLALELRAAPRGPDVVKFGVHPLFIAAGASMLGMASAFLRSDHDDWMVALVVAPSLAVIALNLLAARNRVREAPTGVVWVLVTLCWVFGFAGLGLSFFLDI